MKNVKKELKSYINNNLEKDKKSLFDFFVQEEKCEESFPRCSAKFRKAGSSIENYIDENSQYSDFQTMLFKLIDNKNLKDSDVYNKVHIDRRLFSKIRSSKDYHPSKETIILLGIALELSENELDELLESASYSLPKNNEYDLIIRFCFINKIFKLKDINDLLYEYNCKLFS